MWWGVAVSKKPAKKTYTAAELKERVWQQVLAKGINNLAYNDPLISELEKYKDTVKVEVPAFTATLQELSELVDNVDWCTGAARAINAAIKMGHDTQSRYEYHEREMERHAKMAEKLLIDLKNGAK